MRLTCNVGQDNRNLIDYYSQKWAQGNAETLRIIIMIGLGGTIEDGDEVNAEMANWRKAAEDYHGRAREPGPREAVSLAQGNTTHAPVVAVRVPAAVGKQVEAAGGLKAVLFAGLQRLEEENEEN